MPTILVVFLKSSGHVLGGLTESAVEGFFEEHLAKPRGEENVGSPFSLVAAVFSPGSVTMKDGKIALERVTPSADWPGGPTRICIGIATRFRPHQLRVVVDHLRQQTLQPSSVIISCVSSDDVGDLAARDDLRIVYGHAGAARQRNVVLRNLPLETDIVVFFDDDFVPHRDWLRNVASVFRDDPTIACITGNVIADGIKGPGLTFEDAMQSLRKHKAADATWVIENYSPYGCNMAFRRTAIEGLWFDERLGLYAWLEDRDFGAAVARGRGRVIKLGTAVGVHLGVKRGRVSGRKLGYSQVMNPAYLRAKGTMTTSQTIRHVFKNVGSNLKGSLQPEPFIDRRGRLLGNLIAVTDLLRGRLTPQRAETI
jgi:GT2 family glycosyltransferase